MKAVRFAVLLVTALLLGLSATTFQPPTASAQFVRADRPISIGATPRNSTKYQGNDWSTVSSAIPAITNSNPRILPLTREVWFATNATNSEDARNWGIGARTLDRGANWTTVPDPGIGTQAGAIHFAKDAGNRIWMLVQEFPTVSTPKTKVYFSDDTGSNWTLAYTLGTGASPQAVRGWRIVTNPTNANVIAVIGFSIGLPNATDFRGFILYTTDRGSTWTTNYSTAIRMGQAGQQQHYDALMLPNGRIIAEGPFWVSTGAQRWSVKYSTDYGVNWTESWSMANNNTRINGIFSDTVGSKLAFLYTPDVSAGGGLQGRHNVMLSTNGGDSFTQLTLSQELYNYLLPDVLVTANTFAMSPEGDAFYLSTANFTKKVVKFSPVSSSGTWTDVTYDYPYSTWGSENLGIVRDMYEPRNVRGGQPGCPNCPVGSDPVNLATGNFSHEHIDGLIPGKGYPLSFQRVYNSQDQTAGRLGYGWQDNLNIRLLFSDADHAFADVTVVHEYGRQDDYLRQADGTYQSPQGNYDVLARNGDGTFDLRRKDGSKRRFDANGVVQWIQDRNGNQTTFTYTSGKLTSVSSPGGRSLTFTYDASNRIKTITDPLNRVVEFTYDGNGDLWKVKDVKADPVAGPFTVYTYSNHRMMSLTDSNGHVAAQNTYDSIGRVVEQKDAFNSTTCIYYYSAPSYTSSACPGVTPAPSAGQTVMVDPKGNKTTETFNELFWRTETKDALTGTVTYTYDSNANLSCVTDPRGNKTAYAYDSRGNLTERIDPLNTNSSCQLKPGGVKWRFDYGSDDLLDVGWDTLNRPTEYVYDGAGNLIKVLQDDATGAVKSMTCFERDGSGLVTAEILSTTLGYPCTGNKTEFGYDSYGNLTCVINPRFSASFDCTDESARKTTFIYDNGSRVLFTADELTNFPRPAKPQASPVPETPAQCGPSGTGNGVDEDGDTFPDDGCPSTSYTYDNQNNLLSTKDALGNTATNAYDAKGLLTKTTNAKRQPVGSNGAETGSQCGIFGTGNGVNEDAAADDTVADDGCPSSIYSYDNADRLLEVTQAMDTTATTGAKVTYTYDANGNRTAVTSPKTALRPVGSNGPESPAQCGSSGLGNGVNEDAAPDDTVADDGCPSVLYAYDALNRLQSVTDQLNRITLYQYDAASNLNGRADANHGPIGSAETGAQCGTSGTGNGVDDDGDTIADDGCPNTLYTYDEANRLKKIEHWNGPALADSVQFTLDAVSNRTQMVDPTGTTNYAYDALNRLTCVGPNAISGSCPSGNVGYTYDDAPGGVAADYPGQRTKITYADQTKYVDYTYLADGRMSTVKDWLNRQTAYTYGDSGRLDRADYPSGFWTTYTYDAADRLTNLVNTNANNVGGSFSYMLDAVGNRVQEVNPFATTNYVYDALGRLTSGSSSYTYDPNGNRLTQGATNYTYNAADQMTAAGAVSYGYDNNGNQTGRGSDQFFYDHENRLTQSVIGGVTSSSIYNGDGLRMSHTVSGITANYTWDVASSLPEVLTDGNYTYVYGLDLVSATDAGGNQRYYMHNGLGSVSLIAEQGGGLRAEYYYSEFGLPTFTWEFDASPNDRRFTGEQRDGDSGMYYLRARYYDPATGRFLGRDPIPGGNLYVYTDNNPVNRIDPSGLCFGLGDCGPIDDVDNVLEDAYQAGDDVVSALVADACAEPALLLTCASFDLGPLGFLGGDIRRAVQIADLLPIWGTVPFLNIPASVISGVLDVDAFIYGLYDVWSSPCPVKAKIGMSMNGGTNLAFGLGGQALSALTSPSVIGPPAISILTSGVESSLYAANELKISQCKE